MSQCVCNVRFGSPDHVEQKSLFAGASCETISKIPCDVTPESDSTGNSIVQMLRCQRATRLPGCSPCDRSQRTLSLFHWNLIVPPRTQGQLTPGGGWVGVGAPDWWSVRHRRSSSIPSASPTYQQTNSQQTTSLQTRVRFVSQNQGGATELMRKFAYRPTSKGVHTQGARSFKWFIDCFRCVRYHQHKQS